MIERARKRVERKKVKKGNITTLLADTKKNKKNGAFMGAGAWEFLTPTNNKECFNQLKYAEKLARTAMPSLDKAGFIRNTQFLHGVSFPNFSITESEDFLHFLFFY